MTGVRPSGTWSLAQWLAWLEEGPRGGIDLGLERVQRVADRMGLAPCKTVTIAGTNGKGSCAQVASELARACGYRTGLYTSPHLTHFGERIRVDGIACSYAQLVAAFQHVEQARQDEHLTYFEFTTLAALSCFQTEAVDLRVLEVGLGGRLDAVNVVDADVAVITSIGLDHTAELGETIDAIAPEKAGVARAGKPAIMAMAEPPAALPAALARIGARIIHADTVVGPESIVLDGFPAPLERLFGCSDALQRNGAGAALALHYLGVSVEAITAHWPAVAAHFSLAGRQQRHGDLLLDVAHNREAAVELASALQSQGLTPCWFVLGMLEGKPVEAVAEVLAPIAAGIVCVGLDSPRRIAGPRLAKRIRSVGIDSVMVADTVTDGLRTARERAKSGETIVVTGSFLTVAGALQS